MVRNFFRQSGVAKLTLSMLALSVVASLGACSSTHSASTDGNPDSASVQDSSSDSTSASSSVESAGSADHAGGGRAYHGSRAPNIAQSPFEADGRWMNAFYFVLSPQENWETLSNLIYGRPDRADLIGKWNHEGTLTPGRVIYYNSPIRPDDTANMKVLADDFNIPLEKVEVKAGDSLSLIGQGHYGNVQSWREIAAINPSIKNPDRIEIGQVLSIQPAQLNTKAALDQLIAQANATPPAQQAAADKVDQSPTTQQAPSADTAPTEAGLAPSAKSASASIKSKSSNMALKLGAILVIVGIIMAVIRQRTLKRNTWDESDAHVTKMTSNGL